MKDDVMFKKHLRNYLLGGIGALAVTLGAFSLVMNSLINGLIGATIILGLAAVQAIIQLYCFLHLGEEKKPRWKNYSFLFTVLTVLIIIAGSVWVVSRMNYHMMLTPIEMNQYMMEQNKEGF